MASLLEYEQSLSNHERDAGIVTVRDADENVTDTAARVRHIMATGQRKVRRGHATAIRLRTTATNPRT